MVRIILGVIVGFVAWTILWLGSDQVLMRLSPGWYGAHQLALEKAIFNGTEFTADTTILAIHIFRSIIITVIAGFLAAYVAAENKRSTLILGVVLLLVGVMFQMMVWNYLPIWYHLIFLALLIPMTILGGRAKAA
jgi:uncharacterized membrane protein YeaQ/YmgE (transglycosylase-associated protein family)